MTRNFIYSAISAASAVLFVILAAIVGRALGDVAWGQFSWAVALATIGEGFMDLGIHQVTIRSVARDKSTALSLFRNSLALKLIPGVAMFLLLSGAALWLRPEPTVRAASILLLISAMLRSYLLTIRGVLQGMERFGDDTLIVVGDRVLLLVVGAMAIWLHAGVVGVAVAFIVARVLAVAAGFAIAYRHVGPPLPAFDTAVWRDLQRRALPLGAFLIVLNFYSYIDTVMLGVLSGDAETGLYNYAYRIYEGLTYAPAILAAVLTPRLSRLWGADRPAHRRVGRLGLLSAASLAVMISSVVWWISPWLLALVFGAQALPSAFTLQILSAGLVFVFTIWILHAIAISVFQERRLLYTTLIGALVNAGLNLWLIPRYGRDGAAMATVLGEALTMTLLLIGLRGVLGRGAAP